MQEKNQAMTTMPSTPSANESTNPNAPLRNWAGNLTYAAARVHYPETIEQLRQIITQSAKVRVIGSRHSFNRIADTAADLISLTRLNQSNAAADDAITINPEQRTVTVNAGVTYGQLGLYLHQHNFAIHNMASLPHISIAGACATATHGSGNKNGNLATSVSAIEFIAADGSTVTLSRQTDGDAFRGAVVNLGALGVVTKMTLDLIPAFAMQQEVYENLPVAQLEAHFDEITDQAYSVSLFTHWQNERISQVWLKRSLPNNAPAALSPLFYEATLAPQQRHPIIELSAKPTTEQMGVMGPWHERLPHFRIEETPSSGAELQSEYFVPRQHAVEAMRAVTALRDHLSPVLMISEVRTIAADALWMSPCYQQACIGLHFTWHLNWPKVQKVLPLIENALAPFEVRPHWGKLFTMEPAQVQARYARLPDFRALLDQYDPAGKFRNDFINSYVFA